MANDRVRVPDAVLGFVDDLGGGDREKGWRVAKDLLAQHRPGAFLALQAHELVARLQIHGEHGERASDALAPLPALVRLVAEGHMNGGEVQAGLADMIEHRRGFQVVKRKQAKWHDEGLGVQVAGGTE